MHAGRVQVYLGDLPSGQEDDRWHQLMSLESRKSRGSIRFRALFKDYAILPIKEYAQLKDVCMCVCIQFVHVCMQLVCVCECSLYVCLYACGLYVCVHVVCMCVYACICMCVHAFCVDAVCMCCSLYVCVYAVCKCVCMQFVCVYYVL